MKFMLLLTSDGQWEKAPKAEIESMYGKIGEWWSRHAQAGTIVEGSQLQPARTAKTVRLGGGQPVVTDGPFVEGKEVIGGYAIINVKSQEEALTLAKSWPAGGAVEVRPLIEMAEPTAEGQRRAPRANGVAL